MNRLAAPIFLISLILAGTSFARATSVSYQHTYVRGAPVDIISIDLKDRCIEVTPVVSKNFPKAPENFESMVSRHDPLAAINGNFFCKNTYRPVGDIVIDGKLVHFGGLGTAMAITKDNRVDFVTVERYRHMDWSSYKAVMSCGPRLLENGFIVVDAAKEGFKDPNLFGARNRSAVGTTWDRKLLFVTVNSGVHFNELGAIMKELGCKDAMNLDGGGSTGLYYKGQTLQYPLTQLPDILVVQERENDLMVAVKERLGGEQRIELFSSVAMVVNEESFLVKGIKDGKVYLLMKFDDTNKWEAPQLDAKIDTSGNRITISVPIEKLKDLFKT